MRARASDNRESPRGQAVIAILFLLSASTVIGGGLASLSLRQIRASRLWWDSLQSYAAAESGAEDAVYRIQNDLSYVSSSSLVVGSAQARVTVTSESDKRTVVSEGHYGYALRRAQATMTVRAVDPEFVALQTGKGGFSMAENSSIEGLGGAAVDVYGNGSVLGSNGATVKGNITAATAAGSARSNIDAVVVSGNASAGAITNSKICGNAFSVTIDASSLAFLNAPSSKICALPLTPGAATALSADPPPRDLPLSAKTIADWKVEAAAGGTISGNCGDSGAVGCVIPDNGALSLGPKKITGNLSLTKKQTLIVTGVLYVQGYISIDSPSGVTVQCDPAFGAKGCVIVTDSWVNTANNAVFNGSGQAGSYVLLVTTLAGCNGGTQTADCASNNSAVNIKNNVTGAIWYAPDSLVYIANGTTVLQITAYKVQLSNGAKVVYDPLLDTASFASKATASFELNDWKEVE